jgi:hypothetical protein
MRPRVRDTSFLYIAFLAGGGGLLAIVASIGVPIWMSLHGHHYEPAFSLFTGWGVAALGGAYGCWHTYRLTDTPPPPPPRGGLPITVLHTGVAVSAQPERQRERRAA